MNAFADLLLASKSPRRRELLAQIGVSFETIDVSVEEILSQNESPRDYVQRLASAKALAGVEQNAARGGKDIPVLGSDTTVVCGAEIMEKPKDEADAIAMLERLSGAVHRVITAVCVGSQSMQKSLICETQVHFRVITDEEARRYWQTGEPKDKAGGYGIQGFGGVFVEKIEGSYSNVVGLPLFETYQLLNEFSIPYWNAKAPL